MAIRKLRYEGDPVLGKVCKEVKEMTPHLKEWCRICLRQCTQQKVSA